VETAEERHGPSIQRPPTGADTAAVGNEGFTCAECGEPVDPDLSYIMSVPVGSEPLYHHPACIGLDPY
jgi:hypothetical protein